MQLRRAQHLLEIGRADHALPILRDLVAHHPSSGPVLVALAHALLDLDDLEEAERMAREAVAALPHDSAPLRILALVLARRRKLVPAKAAANAAVELSPQDWRSHYTLAQIDEIVGSVGRYTVDAAGNAVRLAPLMAAPHILLGNALFATGRRHEAESAYRTALRLDPQNTSAQLGLSAIQMTKREWASSARNMASILAVDPQAENARYNLLVPLKQLLWRLAILSVPLSFAAMAAIEFGPGYPVLVFAATAALVWLLSRPFRLARRGAAIRRGTWALLSRSRRWHVAFALAFLGLTVAAWIVGWIVGDANVTFRLLVLPVVGTAVMALLTLVWINE
ncbi:tetratricopeptide repeat protein [Schumannella luteola]